MVLVRGSLLAICLGLSSALGAQQKRGLLDDFDVECLRTMMEDDAAREALSKLKSVTVDSELDPENLLDFQALELSEHVSCVTYSSAKCGEVVVLPPREQASETVQAISDEIEAMSDEQVLRAVNYDLNGLCAAVSEVEAALEPHKECLETNMEVFAGLSSYTRKMVIELLTGSVDPNNPNPWDFDFSSALQFTEGCDSFKASVASSIRSQLSSESWSNLLTQVYSAYDGESFDARVSADIGGDSTTLYGCTVAPELICTKLASVFSSTCELISEHDYDFTLNAPIDGSTDPGSNYYNAFNQYAEKHSGEYPCTDVFSDPCLSKYLEQSPEIPDLMLEMTCRSTGFYYSSVGEDPPSEDDGEGDMGGDNGGEGDGDNNGEDGEGDADGSGDGNGDGKGDGKGDGSGPNPTSSTENNKSLTTGGTVAIVLGVLAVVGLVGVVAFFFLKKRKSSHKYQIQLE